MSVIEWVSVGYGAVTTIATALIGCFAYVSVRLNRELAKDNRLLRKAGTEPEVAAFLKSDLTEKQARNFVLANVGQGPAKNVKFTIRASQAEFESRSVTALFRTNTEIHGASFLPQGDRIESFFGMAHLLANPTPLQPFDVDVTYEDLRGSSRKTTYTLDISETKWIAWLADMS